MGQMPVGAAIAWLADKDPARPAITHEGRKVTRRELDLASNRGARALAQAGVRRDDFVMIAAPNSIAAYEAICAIWKLGATPMPVSARLALPELQAIADLAKPAALIAAPDAAPISGVQVIAPDALAGARFSDASLEPVAPRRLKALTSGGSSGRPKIILPNLPGLVDPETPAFLMDPAGAQLVSGPLHHSAPFNLSTMGLLAGVRLVVMTRFDAQGALDLIGRERIDWAFFVPTMMHRIMRLPEAARAGADLSSLRVLTHAGSKCSAELKRAWIAWLGAQRVFEFYGSSEGVGYTWITGEEWLARPGSVGRPLPGHEALIVRPDGSRAAPGEIGEIYMRAGATSPPAYEYIGATSKRREDGFESVGDLGWADEAGYLYIADRSGDLIIRGGANIYPAEVEAAIETHPAVVCAVVVGRPDPDLGESVHAVVQTLAPLDAAGLSQHLADRLTAYKRPASYSFVSEALRDDAGKVRRGAIAARFARPEGEGT